MSIIIKSMTMPKNCMDCPFKGFDRAGGRRNLCTINESITFNAVLDGVDVKFVRMDDCPLIPVPDHGRLGDLDALIEKRWDADTRCGYVQVIDVADIEEAPTIIPASIGDENG